MKWTSCTPRRKAFFVFCAFVAVLAVVKTWNREFTSKFMQLKNLIAERDDPALEDLLHMFEAKIAKFKSDGSNWKGRICSEKLKGVRPCFDKTCPADFSASPKERLRQVLSVRTNIPAEHLRILASIAKPVTSHKYIFVTAVSSNHYGEMQALLNSMFQNLFPALKGEDYALVIYDLGLRKTERKLTQKYCRCTVVDFPIAEMPDFAKHLKCFVWKPLIVASLLEKAEYLVYMDSSARWTNSALVANLFRKVHTFGFMTIKGSAVLAGHILPKLAQFFDDQPCQYSAFREFQFGFTAYYNDRFTREAIVQPWLACALSINCMCFPGSFAYRPCRRRNDSPYGQCHRFDQSALNLIITKLFLGNRGKLLLPPGFRIRRGDHMNWFNST